jgi:nucleoside-diphosphate-sugar epimerase
MIKILVSGTSSGLGRFLYEELGADKFDRNSGDELINKKIHYDIIIHCAFNVRKNVTVREYQDYLSDTVFLTERLTKIKNNLFIFISSVDVYPKNLKTTDEDFDFNLDDIDSIYGRTKLLCEFIIKKTSNNFSILRISAPLGKYSKKNSLIKLLTNDLINFTLSDESSFNYILYEDILSTIKKIIDLKITGTFNIVSSTNIKLKEVAQNYNIKNFSFGKYTFLTPKISNQKIVLIENSFKNTSLNNIEIFHDKYISKFLQN